MADGTRQQDDQGEMRLHLGFRTGYFNKYPTKGPTPLYLRPFYGSGVRFWSPSSTMRLT
jgi:hypothetical protein